MSSSGHRTCVSSAPPRRCSPGSTIRLHCGGLGQAGHNEAFNRITCVATRQSALRTGAAGAWRRPLRNRRCRGRLLGMLGRCRCLAAAGGLHRLRRRSQTRRCTRTAGEARRAQEPNGYKPDEAIRTHNLWCGQGKEQRSEGPSEGVPRCSLSTGARPWESRGPIRRAEDGGPPSSGAKRK